MVDLKGKPMRCFLVTGPLTDESLATLALREFERMLAAAGPNIIEPLDETDPIARLLNILEPSG